MTQRLLLLRHGATEYSESSRYAGHSDIGLTPNGREQALRRVPFIERFAPDLCLCSPLQRCRQTREQVAPVVPFQTWSELSEISFGDWEGQTHQEIARREPAALARMGRWEADFAPGGGERVGDFCARVEAAAERLRTLPAERILLVTHGGVLRRLLCLWLRLPLATHSYCFSLPPASLIEVALHSGAGDFPATILSHCPNP